MDPQSPTEPFQPEFKWIDSGAVTMRADVCQIQSTRDETMLLFGSQQAPQAEGERSARLERRIVLSPSLAKQLSAALKSAIRAMEARLGAANATPAGNIRSAPSDADAPEAARPLLDRVRRLGVGFGFEKSLKLARDNALTDRIILGVRSRLTNAQALLRICHEIGMPAAHLAQFEESLPDANTVGFGFEGGPQGGLFKVYLEFWEQVSQRVRHSRAAVQPELLFLGFKWDARDNAKSAVARYVYHPLLSITGITDRLQDLYENRQDSPSLQATRKLIELASGKLRDNSFVYVEASEEGNPRKSFDINFYKAGLRLADLQPVLETLWQRYAIPGDPRQVIDARAGACPFGHLSGGLGRDGQDFLTVYYELEGI